jgi:hypothetical protein
MLMTGLYVILVLSTLAVLWAVVATVVRVRKQLRASETTLRKALDEIEEDRKVTRI